MNRESRKVCGEAQWGLLYPEGQDWPELTFVLWGDLLEEVARV